MKSDAPFQYKFIGTYDRELFDAYVELRRRVYPAEYPWLSETFGLEDDTDQISVILVADQSGVVAAGARLTISRPEAPRLLPLEEAGFTLRACDVLRDLRLDRTPYGEISRMAANPVYAHGLELSWNLGNTLCARAAAEGLDTVFCICPRRPALLNERNAKRCGVTFRKYCELPTVFGRNMWLCAFSGLLRIYRGEGEER